MDEISTNRRLPLEVISVANPCEASWDSMAGDARSRFCDHCGKHIHNLSAMPREEAERLVCEAAGALCIRYARDAAGRVLTLDYQAVAPAEAVAAVFVWASPRQKPVSGVMGSMAPLTSAAGSGASPPCTIRMGEASPDQARQEVPPTP